MRNRRPWPLLTLTAYLALFLFSYLLLNLSRPLPSGSAGTYELAFDGQRAFDNVAYLVEHFPRRETGSQADRNAARWVQEKFAALGLQVREQQFRAWGAMAPGEPLRRQQVVNIIAVSPGREPKAILLGAHRDVVATTVQGAEDNGSGTGALLELARALTGGSRPHRYTYLFVSFGGEEIGLAGSRHFVAQREVPVVLAVAVDMVGQAGAQHLDLMDFESLPLPAALALLKLVPEAQASLARPPHKVLTHLARLPLGHAGGTDSYPFALNGIPAVGIAWDPSRYPYWHQQEDTLEHVSPASLQRAGRLVEHFIRAVEDENLLAGSPRFLLTEGRYVPPWQVEGFVLLVLLFALSQPLLAWLRGREAGIDIRMVVGRDGVFIVASLAAAGGLSLFPLVIGLWERPRLDALAAWAGVGLAALLVLVIIRHFSRPNPILGSHFVLSAAILLAFVLAAVLVNPFLALYLLGYHLLVLSRITLRPGLWRLGQWAATLLGLGPVVGALGITVLGGLFSPGLFPWGRLHLFLALFFFIALFFTAYVLKRPRRYPSE